MTGSHLQARSTKIYSNNRVYSPAGLLMFRCSDKKLNWYIAKNLAESIPHDLYSNPSSDHSANSASQYTENKDCKGHVGGQPQNSPSAKEGTDCGGNGRGKDCGGQAIRLLFEPRGTGRNRVGDEWYLEDQQDRCVVCGREGFVSTDNSIDLDEHVKSSHDKNVEPGRPEEGVSIGLTLHHVVPYQYRREMPTSFKSHGSHDVLVLCTADHDHYEKYADEEKAALVERYDAPLGGRGWIKFPRHDKVRAAASALLRYSASIPPDRIGALQETVMDYYDLNTRDEITRKLLEEALLLKAMVKGEGFRDHGQIVIDALREQEGEAGFADFVRFWRRHFLEVMKPRFLSPRWSVDDPVNLVAGEYNPYRPEMDGS